MSLTEQDIPRDLRNTHKIVDGRVYCIPGRYYYQDELWERYMAEGRRPLYDHDFAVTQEYVEEKGVPEEWGRCAVKCSTCGEERLIFWGIGLHALNRGGWCIKPRKTFWEKVMGK